MINFSPIIKTKGLIFQVLPLLLLKYLKVQVEVLIIWIIMIKIAAKLVVIQAVFLEIIAIWLIVPILEIVAILAVS